MEFGLIFLFALGIAILTGILFLKTNNILKFTTIFLSFILASIIYFSVNSYKGWPIDLDYIDGKLIYFIIERPSNIDPGSIYVWLYPKEKENNIIDYLLYNEENKPRAYRIPYNVSDAQNLIEVMNFLKQGYNISLIKGEDNVLNENNIKYGEYNFLILPSDNNQKGN